MMKRRYLSALLTAIMIVCMAVMPACAATMQQDGLSLSLTTDSSSYNPSDAITSTLTLQNQNAYDLSNVNLTIHAPSGYVFVNGATGVKTVPTLAAGGTETFSVQMRNPNPDVPIPPVTGDQSNIGLWIALLLGSLLLLGFVSLSLKRSKRTNMTTHLLILMLLFSFVAAIPAGMADTLTQTITITHTVAVGDASVTIKGTVTYDTSAVGHEISFKYPTEEHIAYDSSKDEYYVDNQILLTVVPNTLRARVEELAQQNGGVIVGAIDITGDYQIEFPAAMTYQQLEDLAAGFRTSSMTESALLHILFPASVDFVPNDREWSNEAWSAEFPEDTNWGVEAIDAMSAWDYRSSMHRINVGIADSMFDTNHEDLGFQRVWNNPPTPFSNLGVAHMDTMHGTHVTGTFSATFNNALGVAGVATNVQRYGYAFFGNTDAVLTDAGKTLLGHMDLKYMLALLATSDCRVINLSMGWLDHFSVDDYATLDSFITKLFQQGYDFLIVQAAGNDNVDASRAGLFVGCVENRDSILVVGSVGTNGSHTDRTVGLIGERVFDGYYYSSFSNWGNRVDVVAPGEDIYSTVLNNNYEDFNDTTQLPWSGTSMAAPHVSGVAAMCYSLNPNLTAAQVKDIIVRSASDSGSTFITRTNDTISYPMLDAKDAVEMAFTYSPTDPRRMPNMGTVMGSVFVSGSNRSETVDAEIAAYRTASTAGDDTYFTASTISDVPDGAYALVLEPGIYTISFYKEGYMPFIVTGVRVSDGVVTYLDDVLMIRERTPQNATVSGTISNSETGDGIPGVLMTFYPGWNNTNTIPDIWNGRIVTCTTDEDGDYSAALPEGHYTAVLRKDGFADGAMNILCVREFTSEQNGAMSPLRDPDEYQIVLTWGEYPRDLDSHLTGQMAGGVHVYYSRKVFRFNGEVLAELDHDDVTSYGPETITIHMPETGTFRYSVHDYTNRNLDTSSELARSAAKVTVYKGNEVIATFSVPNKPGTAWTVFELANDVITPVNTMAYIPRPVNVGAFGNSLNAPNVLEFHEDDKDYN